MNTAPVLAAFQVCQQAVLALLDAKQPWLTLPISKKLKQGFNDLGLAVEKASRRHCHELGHLMSTQGQFTEAWNTIVQAIGGTEDGAKHLSYSKKGQSFALLLVQLQGLISQFLSFEGEAVPGHVRQMFNANKDVWKRQHWDWPTSPDPTLPLWQLYSLPENNAEMINNARWASVRRRYGLHGQATRETIDAAVARLRFYHRCQALALPKQASEGDLVTAWVEQYCEINLGVPRSREEVAKDQFGHYQQGAKHLHNDAQSWAFFHRYWFWADCLHFGLRADEATPWDIDFALFTTLCKIHGTVPRSVTWFVLCDLGIVPDPLRHVHYGHDYWATPVPDEFFGKNDLEGLE